MQIVCGMRSRSEGLDLNEMPRLNGLKTDTIEGHVRFTTALFATGPYSNIVL